MASDFIRQLIEEDLKEGRCKEIITRFPPEPNGYLHIGHAKSICLNFGIAEEYKGRCHLRMDDTNPEKEEEEYVEAIKRDVKWLGFEWGTHMYFASDYFEKLYEYAVHLIKKGKAYVCHLSQEEIREYRGTLTEPGRESPYRNRTIEENLVLFERMKNGEFEEGECVLRAKIDMSSPNINMRDPVLYRIIKNVAHYRTGNKWCIYPTYDFAHPLSDAIEGVTHSICTLEFEDHRPLYEWIINEVEPPSSPKQIEFARLRLSYTVLSKRKLKELVERKIVDGWDDPRMPTISGLRRRGYTPEAIRDFCQRIGVSKAESLVDIALLEHCVRVHLNKCAPRRMAVLSPLLVVIDNYPDEKVEELDAENNPEDKSAGRRKIPFSKFIYIERDDFREVPPPKFFRLSPGHEVRLKHAYYIKCVDVEKDRNTGEIIKVHCLYDPETKGGWSADGRKVLGTLHWVSAPHAIDAQVRLYDRLFLKPNPEDDEDFKESLNPNSLKILSSCKVEPSLKNAPPESKYQFLRLGYFCVDKDSSSQMLIFNRIVPLKDTWAKIEKKMKE